MCSPWTFARCDSLCLESALSPEQRILHPRSLILKGLNRTQVIWGKKSTKNWANKTPAILRLKSLGVAAHQKICWGVLWYEWILLCPPPSTFSAVGSCFFNTEKWLWDKGWERKRKDLPQHRTEKGAGSKERPYQQGAAWPEKCLLPELRLNDCSGNLLLEM